MSARAALLALALLPALPAQAQMYKCVDARGVTHYSDSPRADCKGAKADIRAQPPISGKLDTSGSDMGQAERDLRGRQMQREREQQQEAKADEQQKRRCASLRAEHHNWTSVSRIAVTNDKGERRYLEDAEREAQRARLEAAIARECR